MPMMRAYCILVDGYRRVLDIAHDACISYLGRSYLLSPTTAFYISIYYEIVLLNSYLHVVKYFYIFWYSVSQQHLALGSVGLSGRRLS